MKTYNLDTIQKVPLREVWPHEAHDFTKWLAEEQNLATLGMAVGIELELIETESSVGSFNVDIYAQESGTGRKVIIEHQLEDTNHDHLGKVITYAAGKGAEVVIWVVAHARDEHRQAIEWLNQHTDSDFGFFLVEVELWKIGDSLPAPRFGVVEQPNEWTKTVKLSEGLSETEKVKLVLDGLPRGGGRPSGVPQGVQPAEAQQGPLVDASPGGLGIPSRPAHRYAQGPHGHRAVRGRRQGDRAPRHRQQRDLRGAPRADGGALRCEKGLGTALLQGGPPHQGPPGRMAGVHRGTARMGSRDEEDNRGDWALKNAPAVNCRGVLY